MDSVPKLPYQPTNPMLVVLWDSKRLPPTSGRSAGKVKYVIGYERDQNGLIPKPVFIKDPEDVDRLIWDSTCIHNLTKFLVDEKKRKAAEKKPDERPVGIVVKGCDSRAIIVLLQENTSSERMFISSGFHAKGTGSLTKKRWPKSLRATKRKKSNLTIMKILS